MSALLKAFSKFTVQTAKDVGTVITVESIDKLIPLSDICEIVDELNLDNLSIHLPQNQIICDISELEHYRSLAPALGKVKSLTVVSDMLTEESELEWLSGVQDLTLALRRPKEGINLYSADTFLTSFLSYIEPDAIFRVILFSSDSSGPARGKRKLSSEIQNDIDRVDELFLSFKKYDKCAFQHRILRVSDV